MAGKSRCVECPLSQKYYRTELYYRKKKLHCKYHVVEIDKQRLVTCFTCPSTHAGWKQSEIRRPRGVDYCLEHLPPEPKGWPSCPKCSDEDFGRFEWKGSVKKATITCEECGFKDLAIHHHEPMTVWQIAAPIGESPPK